MNKGVLSNIMYNFYTMKYFLFINVTISLTD